MTTPKAAPTFRREKERFVALAFCRADLLFELKDDQTIAFAAGATPAVWNCTPDALIGQALKDFIAPNDHQLLSDLLAVASAQGRLEDAALHIKVGTKDVLRVLLSGYRVPDFDNHFFIALKIAPKRNDASVQVERETETGLMETHSYAHVAAERVSSFLKAGGQAQVSMVKVNHLTNLFDTVGASDKKKLLGQIGKVLNDHSIGGDTASRIDQDSFSITHDAATDPETLNREIESVAANFHPDGAMVQAVSNTLDVDGAGLDEGQVARALIHTMQKFCANQGMVREGSLSDAIAVMMDQTVENVGFIKKAIEKRDLDIVYMPICDLKNNYVHHFEGLVRFRGERAKESPYSMICLAEEIGIIYDLDMAILKCSVEAIHSLRQQKYLPPVAINLSGASLSSDAFMKELIMTLREVPELSGALLFEITESARIEDLPAVNRKIQALRRMGFQICLDDFGSGSASFDYLNALDVDVVKFDGPVVKRAYSTEKGGDLLKAMTAMCHDLNIHTVAEMVEDEAMANHMRDCHIDFGQGWFFGKPTMDPLSYSRTFAPTSKIKTL